MDSKTRMRLMLKATAWFSGMHALIWFLLWWTVSTLSACYTVSVFNQTIHINRWWDILFSAVHFNLILAGFFWIVPRIKELDLQHDSDSSTAIGLGLVIASLTGMVLIANPTFGNCVNGSLTTGFLIFLIGMVTTRLLSSVLIAAGMTIFTTFIPGLFGGGALIGLTAGAMSMIVILGIGLPIAWLSEKLFKNKTNP